MNFIKKIADNQINESVHLQFQKFSKGEFPNKAVIKAKKVKNKFTIFTTAEYANEMVRTMAEKLGNETAKISGAVVSTSDLTGELDFDDKKQFQGVKKYLINKEMSGKEIIDLLNKFPKTFFALSFSVGDDILKIKPKAPKSGKPGKGKEIPKPDFCKLITFDEKMGASFIFEKPDFKNALISHTFFIDELILPEDEKDFAKMREMAKRKGRIVRTGEIDETPVSQTIEFEA